MVRWNPNPGNHLDRCVEGCDVRHCSCGAPAVIGKWTCGRIDACRDARHEAILRRFTLRRTGGRK